MLKYRKWRSRKLQINQFSWRRQKKKSKCIWTISIWQTHKDHYQKNLSGHRIDDRFSYARFEIYTQTVFHSNSFFVFFGLNFVCQQLARQLSKEIKTMKYYSDRLKPIFARIRPSSTCTYLALVFSVNKWKSIFDKKLAASKKRMMDIGYIPRKVQKYKYKRNWCPNYFCLWVQRERRDSYKRTRMLKYQKWRSRNLRIYQFCWRRWKKKIN